MKRQTKLNSEEQQSLAAGQRTQAHAPHEFDTVEEMLRHDAIHTPVPPDIERHLKKSAATLSGSKGSWLQKLFGG